MFFANCSNETKLRSYADDLFISFARNTKRLINPTILMHSRPFSTAVPAISRPCTGSQFTSHLQLTRGKGHHSLSTLHITSDIAHSGYHGSVCPRYRPCQATNLLRDSITRLDDRISRQNDLKSRKRASFSASKQCYSMLISDQTPFPNAIHALFHAGFINHQKETKHGSAQKTLLYSLILRPGY